MLVDSIELAYRTFQSCRHLQPEISLLLNALILTLDQVHQSGTLVVEIPDLWINSVPTFTQEAIRRNSAVERIQLSQLPQKGQQLLSFIQIAADELKRLWLSEKAAALQSLGYALHCIPSFVPASEKFEPYLYQFCFRVAAFGWQELSPEMQQAFCELMGLELEQAEQLVCAEGFAIDMYGYKRRERIP